MHFFLVIFNFSLKNRLILNCNNIDVVKFLETSIILRIELVSPLVQVIENRRAVLNVCLK